jgi:hypothetical protein
VAITSANPRCFTLISGRLSRKPRNRMCSPRSYRR